MQANVSDTLTPSPRVAYIVSQDLVKISSCLPSNRNRSLLVHALVSKFGLLNPTLKITLEDASPGVMNVIRPRLATVQDLCVYHDRDYVDFVLNSKNSTIEAASNPGSLQQLHEGYGVEDDCPPFHGMDKYVQMVAGATLTAVDCLKSGKYNVAICWDGGRHHARKSRASGFCYVADCILAILSLIKAPPLSLTPFSRKARVMYLDLDLHFSDAVSETFYKPATSESTSQVLTFSIHHTSPGFFPPSSLASLPDPTSSAFDPFTLSLPLLQGASSTTFARVWHLVDSVKNTFCPDYVVVQCGADGLAGDPSSVWNWSIELGRGGMGCLVHEIIHGWGCRILLLGGGGYNSPNAARAWTYLTSIARGTPLPLDASIPDHMAFPLYSTSFTLDVQAGTMRDENSDQYLSNIEAVYSVVIQVLRERMGWS